MKKQLTNTLLMVSVLMLGACGLQDAKSVRSTKEFYFTHVNRPAIIKLDTIENLNGNERVLAMKFAKLDRELTSLTRAMDSVLDPTKQEEVATLLNDFPWLANIYVLDAETDILGAIPATAPAVISFSYLIDQEIKPRELYSDILSTENGSIFLIARPYIQSGTLVGYLAVSFDPRVLLPFVGDASNIFIRTPEDILWSGDLYLPDTPLADIDWVKTIDQDSSGSFSKQGTDAAWFVRYYAHLPMIFGIVESQNEFSDE